MLIAKVGSEAYGACIALVLLVGMLTTFKKSKKNYCLILILAANGLMLIIDALTWWLEYNDKVRTLYVIFTISSVSLLYLIVTVFNYYIYFYLSEKCIVPAWIALWSTLLCAGICDVADIPYTRTGFLH